MTQRWLMAVCQPECSIIIPGCCQSHLTSFPVHVVCVESSVWHHILMDDTFLINQIFCLHKIQCEQIKIDSVWATEPNPVRTYQHHGILNELIIYGLVQIAAWENHLKTPAWARLRFGLTFEALWFGGSCTYLTLSLYKQFYNYMIPFIQCGKL